jgi:hypothetical protein
LVQHVVVGGVVESRSVGSAAAGPDTERLDAFNNSTLTISKWKLAVLLHNVGMMIGADFGILNNIVVELAWNRCVIRSSFLWAADTACQTLASSAAVATCARSSFVRTVGRPKAHPERRLLGRCLDWLLAVEIDQEGLEAQDWVHVRDRRSVALDG